MPDPISVPGDLVGKAVAAIIAAPIAVLVTWLTTRRVQKANIETMIVNAAGGLVDRLEKECARVTTECTALRGELAAVRADLRRCDERHDECEERVDGLEALIRLLQPGEPIPPYTDTDITRADRIGRAAQARQRGKSK